MKYRTKDGDVLDAICLGHYGTDAVVPTVLAANPGLAALGPILSSGLLIELPDIEVTAKAAATVRLWD